MTNKNKSDILGVLEDFKKLITHKPSVIKMVEEVRMMRFKVRPLRGDIASFNATNTELIETLWSLGKLDEFFQKEMQKNATQGQREILFRIFDELNQNFQDKLNLLRPIQRPTKGKGTVLELEILKEPSSQKKVN